jgi:hypothetical protein
MALQLAFAETLLLLSAPMVFGTIQILPARIRHVNHTTVGAHTTSNDGADFAGHIWTIALLSTTTQPLGYNTGIDSCNRSRYPHQRGRHELGMHHSTVVVILRHWPQTRLQCKHEPSPSVRKEWGESYPPHSLIRCQAISSLRRGRGSTPHPPQRCLVPAAD